MLSLRDPSPCLAQATPSIFPPSSSPPCKEEPSTPHRRLLSPLQNAINSLPTTDTVAVKTEDDSTDIGNTMERRNEAGGSQSRSNNHPRPPNPQQEADAELARLLQQEIERAAGVNAPDPAPAQPHLPPLTIQGFGMPRARPPQQGFPEHPFPAVPFTPMTGWSAYDPQAYAELEQFLRQADPHTHGGSPLEANQQNPFFPPRPIASPLTPVGQQSPTARGMSQVSSAPSGNDSSTADRANSQGAEGPRTQAEINAALIAEEKRKRNTAASARFRIKKKHKVINLERSLSDLQRRAAELERETTELRRENTWLKEMVLMKGRGRVGTRRAKEALVETPIAESPNTRKGKGKKRVIVVEQEEDEGDDYTSESEEEGSEDEDEA